MQTNAAFSWKKSVVTAIARLYYYSGLFRAHLWWSCRAKPRTLILMFHRVLPAESPVWQQHLALPTIIVSLENFLRLLKFVGKYFKFVSLPEFVVHAQLGGGLFQRQCILTFDDGYRDFLLHAWPVLHSRRLPVTMFIPTAFMGTTDRFWWDELFAHCVALAEVPAGVDDGPLQELLQRLVTVDEAEREQLAYELIARVQDWPVERLNALIHHMASVQRTDAAITRSPNELLSWDEIRELRAGGVHFGSHTRRHVNLKVVAPECAQQEVAQSKRELESRLQEPVDSFSFPGGHASEAVEQLVKDAGYTHACTTRRGLNGTEEGLFRLRRVNMWDGAVQDHRGRFSPAVTALNLMRTFS